MIDSLPQRMKDLPIDPIRKVPVPWFVDWIDGKPEFRAMDPNKWRSAIQDKLCWVCGNRLGVYLVFVIGPMCGITRTTTEPPCHLECAQWSAANCPFLSRPRMRRREDGLEEARSMGGNAIKRNPGVSLLWITKDFTTWPDGQGGKLITVGEPEGIEVWAEGRIASREELDESIRTGLPFLEAEVEKEAPDRRALAATELRNQIAEFERLVRISIFGVKPQNGGLYGSAQ